MGLQKGAAKTKAAAAAAAADEPTTATTNKNEEEEEEREAWLRARGVEIETREDRLRLEKEREEREAREAKGGDGKRRLTCVKIPSDDALPFEEVTLDVPLSKPGDVLPDAVKSYFIGGGDIDVNLAKRAATKQLGEEFASKSQNLGASLAKETAMGSTETFALVRPSEKNGRKGVYLSLIHI